MAGRGVGQAETPAAAGAAELEFERTFAAPRSLVWRAWTEPELFASWFGPHGTSVASCQIDLRPGGTIRFCHELADGARVFIRGIYREILAEERLIVAFRFVDEAGAPGRHPFFPEWPLEATLVTTVTLAAEGGMTRVSIRQRIAPAEAATSAAVADERRLANQGWTETLARLEELLASESAPRPDVRPRTRDN